MACCCECSNGVELSAGLTQVIAVNTGLQDHFNWRQVASSATVGALSTQISELGAQAASKLGFDNQQAQPSTTHPLVLSGL